MECRRVELKVCSPRQPVRLISARLSGQISALQSLWPSSPKRFIYNGVELADAMTFAFYGIRDGDSIIALPAGGDSLHHTSQWIAPTRDADAFNDALHWMLDPATAAESARLRDIHLLKLEMRPRAFRKMNIADDEEKDPKAAADVATCQPALAPTTRPLPVPWNDTSEGINVWKPLVGAISS
jgi:hypothetical protein